MKDNDVDALALRREARSYFGGRVADKATTASAVTSASSSRDWEEAFDGLVEAIGASCLRGGLGREEVQEVLDVCKRKLTVERIQRAMSDPSSLLRRDDARGTKESGGGKKQKDFGSAEKDQQKPAISPPGLTPVEKLATKLQRQRQQHAMLMETMRMQQRRTEAVVQQQQEKIEQQGRQIEQLQEQAERVRQVQAVANAPASANANDAAKDDENNRLPNAEPRKRGEEKKKKRKYRKRGSAPPPKPKKRPRALCQREGCMVRPQRASELFCHHHKPRICRVEGCGLQMQVGGVCYRHGSGSRRACSVEGCTNQAQKGGVCQRHGLERGIVHFCAAQGCRRHVKRRGGRCRKHEAEGGIAQYPEERCVRVDAAEEGARDGDGEMRYGETEYGQMQNSETDYGQMQNSEEGARGGDGEMQYGETEYGQMQYGQMRHRQMQYGETYGQAEYGEGGGIAQMMGEETEEGVGVEEESESEEEV